MFVWSVLLSASPAVCRLCGASRCCEVCHTSVPVVGDHWSLLLGMQQVSWTVPTVFVAAAWHSAFHYMLPVRQTAPVAAYMYPWCALLPPAGSGPVLLMRAHCSKSLVWWWPCLSVALGAYYIARTLQPGSCCLLPASVVVYQVCWSGRVPNHHAPAGSH